MRFTLTHNDHSPLSGRQHLVYIFGKEFSLFSFVPPETGRRVFKCRGVVEDGGAFWSKVVKIPPLARGR